MANHHPKNNTNTTQRSTTQVPLPNVAATTPLATTGEPIVQVTTTGEQVVRRTVRIGGPGTLITPRFT
jgi:hypothetical protein